MTNRGSTSSLGWDSDPNNFASPEENQRWRQRLGWTHENIFPQTSSGNLPANKTFKGTNTYDRGDEGIKLDTGERSKGTHPTFEKSSIFPSSQPLLEEGLDRHGRVEPDLHPVIDGKLPRFHHTNPSFAERAQELIDVKNTTIGESLFDKTIPHNTHLQER
jgi:hypothetical protein